MRGPNLIYKGRQLTGRTLRRALETARYITSSPEDLGISTARGGDVVELRRPIRERELFFDIQIFGSEQISDNRWAYDWFEVQLNVNNPGQPGSPFTQWTLKTGPTARSHNVQGKAYNMAEVGNTGAGGTDGQGFLVDNLPAGFSMQPIRPNKICRARFLRAKDVAIREVWIDEPNAIDGVCPP